MLVEREALCRALGATEVEVEPLSLGTGAPERVRATLPRGARTFLVRRSADPERAANHLAVLEALGRLRFEHAPDLVAVVEGASVETFVEGLTAMNVELDSSAAAAAVDALAALHRLPIRDGLRWDESRRQTLASEELQLFRLGFTSEERAAAAPWLTAGVEVLEASPFGFCHGSAEADHIVFGPRGPVLVNFEQAGFGPHLLDVAAFLATCGVDSATRSALAERYGSGEGLTPRAWADLVDLATLLWSLDWLLTLPRRLIVNLGDDVASAQLRLAASRVEDAAKQASGAHSAAKGIRQALWGH